MGHILLLLLLFIMARESQREITFHFELRITKVKHKVVNNKI
jgi:hypothetical protein